MSAAFAMLALHQRPAERSSALRVAQVIVDVPTRALETHFDYLVPEHLEGVAVGSCVLVDFARRPAVGYVVGLAESSPYDTLKEVQALLGGPYFGPESAQTARWIAEEYLCPLSEALRLFLPPGGTPRAVRDSETGQWTLARAGTGAVDDRWAELAPGGRDFSPRANATLQMALLDALSAGPVRVAELAADLGGVDGALKTLEKAGAVRIERRRRIRDAGVKEASAPRHERLTSGQLAALSAIAAGRRSGGEVIALDGVTGSGKTEVYLRAIEDVLAGKRLACSFPRSRSRLKRSADSARASATRLPCCTRAFRPASASTSGTSSGEARRASSLVHARRSSLRFRLWV